MQYRLYGQISVFRSNQCYDGQLVAYETVANAGLDAYDLRFAPDMPVEFLDTAGFGFQEITIPESR